MERKVFSSKILYSLNLIFNSGFLLVSILSLLSLIFIGNNRLTDENKAEQIVLYCVYILIYTSAVAILFVKPKKAVFYINLTYLFALVINFYEFLTHYLKSNISSTKFIYIIMILIFITIFIVFIYFNKKYKFKVKFSEIEDIGAHKD